MINLTLLDSNAPEFPNPENALTDPNGLLAIGGNLEPDTLVQAYRQGIFPWFCDGEPLLWWSPDPRAVIFPGQLHISRSLAKLHRQQRFHITVNQAFEQVLVGCSTAPRSDGDGTWITEQMRAAYCELHRQGHAHSVDVWAEDALVGGLYGVAVGEVFCGESMFSRVNNASKLALLSLLELMPGLQLVDCQVPNAHLQSLGATNIPRAEFLSLLQRYRDNTLCWP